jgi:hypothetical protein
MKKFFVLAILFAACSAPPPPPKTPVSETPPCPTLPTCEDKVIVMDEKGATCPANTKATFPMTGYFVTGKTVVLCQCK